MNNPEPEKATGFTKPTKHLKKTTLGIVAGITAVVLIGGIIAGLYLAHVIGSNQATQPNPEPVMQQAKPTANILEPITNPPANNQPIAQPSANEPNKVETIITSTPTATAIQTPNPTPAPNPISTMPTPTPTITEIPNLYFGSPIKICAAGDTEKKGLEQLLEGSRYEAVADIAIKGTTKVYILTLINDNNIIASTQGTGAMQAIMPFDAKIGMTNLRIYISTETAENKEDNFTSTQITVNPFIDLAITGIRITSSASSTMPIAEAYVKKSYYLSLDIKNNSISQKAQAAIKVTGSNSLSILEQTISLNAGEETKVSASFTPTTTGTITYNAAIDLNDYNSSNNSSLVTLKVIKEQSGGGGGGGGGSSEPSLPNLIVSGVDMPAKVYINETFSGKITYTNNGKKETQTSTSKITLDGVTSEQTIDAIAVGASIEKEFTAVVTTTGQKSLEVIADYTNIVKESKETDNTRTLSFTAYDPKPDYIVSQANVTVDGVEVTELFDGQIAQIMAVNGNLGERDATNPSYTQLTINEIPYQEAQAVPSLLPGETSTSTWTKNAEGGTDTGITWVIQPEANVLKNPDDLNLENDKPEVTNIVVFGNYPDYEITQAPTPKIGDQVVTEVYQNETFTLEFTVSNTGRADAPASKLCVFADLEQLVAEYNVPTIPMNSSVLVSVPVTSNRLGQNTFEGIVNKEYLNLESKANTTNNRSPGASLNIIERQQEAPDLYFELLPEGYKIAIGTDENPSNLETVLQVGTQYSIKSKLANKGGDTQNSFKVHYFMNGAEPDKLIDEVTIPELKAGETFDIIMTFTPDANKIGWNDLYVIADMDEQLNERTFNNNYETFRPLILEHQEEPPAIDFPMSDPAYYNQLCDLNFASNPAEAGVMEKMVANAYYKAFGLNIFSLMNTMLPDGTPMTEIKFDYGGFAWEPKHDGLGRIVGEIIHCPRGGGPTISCVMGIKKEATTGVGYREVEKYWPGYGTATIDWAEGVGMVGVALCVDELEKQENFGQYKFDRRLQNTEQNVEDLKNIPYKLNPNSDQGRGQADAEVFYQENKPKTAREYWESYVKQDPRQANGHERYTTTVQKAWSDRLITCVSNESFRNTITVDVLMPKFGQW